MTDVLLRYKYNPVIRVAPDVWQLGEWWCSDCDGVKVNHSDPLTGTFFMVHAELIRVLNDYRTGTPPIAEVKDSGFCVWAVCAECLEGEKG